METKKPRNMSAKGFLHKASGKVSAAAFIEQHTAWLLTGDLADFTAPILKAVADKELMPTPALAALTNVVLGHMIATENAKAEDALLNPKTRDKKSYPWIATVLNAKGEVQTRVKEDGSIENLEKGFEKSSDADRWCDNRLFDGACDWYATVSHTSIINRHGNPLSTIILRDDAIARKLQAPKGAVMKQHSQTTDKLSFGVKCGNDRAVFSKG
jgi:hypothetical protein